MQQDQQSVDTERRHEEALTLLIEECAEVIQTVCKVKRFGADTKSPGANEKNGKMLTEELADLLAVIRLAEQHRAIDLPNEGMIERAIARKQRYSSL